MGRGRQVCGVQLFVINIYLRLRRCMHSAGVVSNSKLGQESHPDLGTLNQSVLAATNSTATGAASAGSANAATPNIATRGHHQHGRDRTRGAF